MTMQVLNLTAHSVIVLDAAGHVLAAFPPAGPVARIEEQLGAPTDLLTEAGAVPARAVRYAERVHALPDPEPGTAYLVSRVLAAAMRRDDLLFPGGEVRDDNGNIIGCRYLGRFEAENADA